MPCVWFSTCVMVSEPPVVPTSPLAASVPTSVTPLNSVASLKPAGQGVSDKVIRPAGIEPPPAPVSSTQVPAKLQKLNVATPSILANVEPGTHGSGSVGPDPPLVIGDCAKPDVVNNTSRA